MKAVIVGAGIGGLSAALSLADAGITDVVVVEAVERLRPLGVGINLLPHAVRELTELGLAEAVAGTGVATAELAYHDLYGSRIWSEPRGVAAGYRWPQYSVHRGRLQMVLLEAVLDRLGPDSVITGHRLTGFRAPSSDQVVADFQTASGATVSMAADVLVGADGIHSAVRAQLNPCEGAPPWNGMVMWRGTTSAAPFLSGRTMIMAGDGSRKFVAYPLSESDPQQGSDRGTALINWVAEVPIPDRAVLERGNWNREVDPGEVLRYFGDWRFEWLDVRALIEAAHAVLEYPMVDREPLERWSHGPVTLLGDAAHAMYPIGSNGASQALLDARVLAQALTAHADVPTALTAYEEQRRPATTAIQASNRRMGPEIVMRMAHERAPEGFARIEDVISRQELESIAAEYKRTAGFDPEDLNNRESFSVAQKQAQ
jgi:2-polyprenyl-6-methoxyphenol hydroxylase-like FAD-dependent oxidoreductase